MILKESSSRFKKDITGQRCMRILEDTYRLVILVNEEKILK